MRKGIEYTGVIHTTRICGIRVSISHTRRKQLEVVVGALISYLVFPLVIIAFAVLTAALVEPFELPSLKWILTFLAFWDILFFLRGKDD
jgi:ABC-type transport system involved in cytochrome c biogenesis permease component